MRVYTTVQAARKLGIGRDTLYRWMRDGLVKKPTVVRVGEGAIFQPAMWTDADLAKIRKRMKKNPHKNLGRKRRKKP
jgi:excisionase family DNA binding protein